MLARITEALIYVLAMYGGICIVGAIIDHFLSGSRYVKQKYELVLTVKNQQDNIEGIIRSIFEDELFKNSGPECKVVVIDKGSDDDTIKILKKLSYEYNNLEVVIEEENGRRL